MGIAIEQKGARIRASVRAIALIVAQLGLLAPALAATPPSFTNFTAPAPVGQDAGEPSIGVNRSTGKVMLQAGLDTLRVSNFNDATRTATWESVGATITSVATLDPILFTDPITNRTFVSQLAAGCSLMAYTDDDGRTWFQNPMGCGLASGVDHQTVGGGPFAPPLTGAIYRDTVYYCAQSLAIAQCALSLDGGINFNPAVPIYSALSCGGLHGHLRAAPDGTVYVPNADCGGKQGVVVSTDNGTTWTVRAVPGSSTQDESDPSVAVGAGGTVYLGYQNGDGHAYAAVSRNRGVSWTNVQDVGAALGIQNIQFPEVIAGDDNRAAFAFLGTKTAGDDQKSSFGGVWHLYVATTYDGGVTWTTVDATPTDPVQRGCIWLGGGSNQCRNLLDFNDITVDQVGRVLVGYADGCVGSCVSGGSNSYSAIATIARQSGGTGLFAAFDPSGPTVPGVPTLSGTAGNATVHLAWTAPSDGGSTITNYKVYRGASSGAETVLSTVGNVTSYDDNAVTNGTTYYYQVSAVNAIGEGTRSNETSAKPQAPSVPSAPQNLSAASAKGNKTGVVLTWQAPVSSGTSAITGYRIYRATTAGGETFLKAVGNVTSYSDTATTSGLRYYYKISAVNAVGEGTASNEASALAK